ncbi:2f843c17-c37a-427c-9e6d-aa7e911a35a6 [Thermothielavioides terrestris]|uniref:2f843c17-c37a-427c-9e6d-aa7e911a35a6 n=1 Tax=Thermothielavioides terrestris TaxID=2587410 RepID=A0A446BBM2_9PEZI|nr:2f843c17-c37a-427c-9e6d-aa7e911a35a6 [Thermothielavioides terrestris]
MTKPSEITGARPPRPRRSRASGSFHAGEPFPLPSPSYGETIGSSSRSRKDAAADPRRPLRPLRWQSTAKYHTFPTPPPAGPPGAGGPVENRAHGNVADGLRDARSIGVHAGRRRRRRKSLIAVADEDRASAEATPLPWAQLGLLALLSLAEQTALNSIGPYLPTMVASFDEIPDGQEGLYVGLLASAFALAQLATNLLWGYLSDRMGRKPVMLLGTSLLMLCFVCFGFCTTYAQLLVVHVAMGLLNGNAAVVPTCLGEVTDRTNQSSAFTWLPAVYSLGSITGPALGGLLAGIAGDDARYPFLAPNMLAAALLLSSVVVLAVWFEETLDHLDGAAASAGSDWAKLVRSWCSARWRELRPSPRGKGRSPSAGQQNSPDRSDDDLSDDAGLSDASEGGQRDLLGPRGTVEEEDEDEYSKKDEEEPKSAFRELKNRNTLAILGTYLVFQLANISFNSLYPIFASSPPPAGRDLDPGTIGVSLSLAGLVTVLFQLSIFQSAKAHMGNLGTYRYSLLGMAVSMALMPWIGYLDGRPYLGLGTSKAWLYSELGGILVLKNICAVGGLSSVMLLITNSALSHETLGTLNGVAQTLSAAGRSVGPFLSGGLFTLSTRLRPKEDADDDDTSGDEELGLHKANIR